MGKYLKMADVFPVEIRTDDESGSLICDEDGVILESFSGDKVADYALHAINSHDELVEKMQHYKQESERWEARATNEASRVQDLVVEVERLTEFCESFSKFCEDVSEFMNHSNDGNSYWKSYQDYKKTKGL